MATVYWRGTAVDESEVFDAQMTGTHTTGDVITVSTATQSFQVEVGSDTANTDIATLAYNALNATVLGTDALVYSSRSKFSEIGPVVQSGVTLPTTDTVRVIGPPGVPLSLSISTSGTGTFTPTTQNSATGRSWANNAENWQGGVLPASSDTVVFEQGSVDCLYGLTELGDVHIEVRNSYTGKIGLPDEYSLSGTTGETFQPVATKVTLTLAATTINIGGGDGLGPSLVRIDADSNAVTGFIDVPAKADTATGHKTVELTNVLGGALDVRSGSVYIDGDPATLTVDDVKNAYVKLAITGTDDITLDGGRFTWTS